MSKSNDMKLNAKFILTLSCVLIGLFLLAAFFTYKDQKQVAEKIALDQGRNVTRELGIIFSHMSDIVRNEPETNYSLVPQVVSTQIAKKISAEKNYSIRQISLNFRNPDNRPDAYETEQLKGFINGNKEEIYSVTRNEGESDFRYMKALIADESCLKCHGSFASAPTFIQQRFLQGHPSYNYKVGDIIGAVSVIKPMAELYGEVSQSLKKAFYYRSAILILMVIVTWFFVRRVIITPIQAASKTIHAITETGNLKERIPDKGSRDEIGLLLVDFNTMMTELDRTTLQRQESEDRYRSLIEAAQFAIITFLENGKIVISNLQAEKLLGLSRTQLLGESFFDFLEDSDRLKAKVAKIAKAENKLKLQETNDYLLSGADGVKRDMEITLVLASAVENTPMFTAILRLQE